MATERTYNKRCVCGNLFEGLIPHQRRCFYCIMKAKPEKPDDDGGRRYTTEFYEWFIYKWHNIRLAGAKLKGVELEFDDGVRGVWKVVSSDEKKN